MTRSVAPHARPLVHRREWIMWFAILAAATGGMLAFRTQLNEAHVALLYLLVVQGGSARGGRPLGFALAATAFLAFDLFFLPPFNTLVIQDPFNWLVLLAFLVTSVVSAQLLYRAQSEAEEARERAVEIDRLAALGAETLNAARAEQALTAIVAVIRSSLALDDCAVYMTDASSNDMRLATESGVGAESVAIPDRFLEWDERGGADAFFRPLQVRGTTVGVLRISRGGGLALTPAQVRVLDALAYYAALGVERVQLVAEAERAAALQEAHRAKDAVIASVSHDLRTPLTTIKGLAHEIAKSGDDRAEVIEEEADRLNTFVAQMLDLSRIATGGAAADVQANEAEDLLGAAAQQVAGRLGEHELRIDVNGGDALLFGRFDFAQMLRALVNLLENAAKYSPASAPIDLAAYRDGAWLVFEVADRGPGVPESERGRIFEPFYRRGDRAPDVGGVGLGLAIARGIVNAQGGDLTVSIRSGGGSVFRICVPAIAVDDLINERGATA